MPQAEDSTKTERVQLKHLLLDVDFYDKPTVKALAYKHGQLSVHLYVRWLTLMSRASNAFVTCDALAAIAQEVGFEEGAFREILTYCLKTKMLVLDGEDSYSNARVIQDQLSCAVKRKEAKERQEKYREKKCDKRVTNALPTRFPVTVSVTDPDHIDLNKNSKPLEVGLVRLGEYVRISEISQEQFITNCNTEGFTDKDRTEIIDALDRWYSKNLHAWHEKDHFRDLMSWPFKNQREHKAKLLRCRGDPKPPLKIAELKKQWIKEGRYKAS